MATGLKIPVGVDKSGGARVETSVVDQKKKLLELAFSERGDDNPFQILGLDPGLIFSLKDAAFRGRAKLEVERILGNFQGLIELSPTDPIEFNFDNEGEVELSFKYVDLEVDKVEEFKTSFTKG